MSGSVNKVILVGNLGQDPEVRHTQDGSPIVQLSVATSDTWKDRATGERRERTEWHRVVCFNEHLCKFAESYLKKGDKVHVQGALQTRKWTDQSGVDKYATEIVLQKFKGELVLLDSRNADSGENSGGYENQNNPSGSGNAGNSDYQGGNFDDEIPFN